MQYKKILLALLIFLCIAPVFAADWDNVKSYKPETITIKNALGLGSTLAKYSLLNNSDYCLVNCWAEGKAEIFSREPLFRNLSFETKQGYKADVDFKIFIQKTKSEIKEHWNFSDFECYYNISGQNETNQTFCNRTLLNQWNETITTFYWEEYTPNTEVDIGNYTWRLEGKKDKLQSVDWIGEAFGEKLTEWAWWNSSWTYRKRINLTNDGSTLNDYILQIELDWDSDMANDFSDIRFTDSDENELNYWIQKYNSGVNATIRVEIPEINADDSSYIWVYYGTGSVSSASDFDALYPDIKRLYTFDFDDTSTAIDYSGNANGVFYNLESGDFVNGRIGKAVKFDGVNEYADFGNLGFNKNATFCLLLDDYDDTAAPSSTSILSNSDVSSWATIGYRANFVHNADEEQIEFAVSDNGGTGTSVKSSATELEGMKSQWTQMCFTWYAEDNMTIYVNGSQVASTSAAFTNTALDPEHLFLARKINSGDTTPFTADEVMIWDDALNETEVAKYWAEAEPTYAFGEEETLTGNPTITINEPENNTNTTSNAITFNCTAEDDLQVDNMSLYINGSVVETFNFGSSNLTSFSTIKTLNSGNYSWYCSVSDNDSNSVSSDTYYFIIDSIKPQINFIAPENSAIYSSPQTWLNYSIYDLHNDTCWYGNETNNYTINCNLNNWTISTHEGINALTIWANDTFGNEHSNSSTFIIDTLTPTIEFEYPTNTSYHYVVTNFTYIFTEANPDTCWYSTNNGTTNTTITCGQNVTGLVSYEGNNTWFLWINDSLGRTNSTNVTFIVDAVPPVLVLHSPLNDSNQVFVNEYPYNVTLNYTATDLSLDSCWYWSDINTTNTTFTCNTDQTITFMTDEPHYIYYYANDSWGNYTEQITFFNVYAHNYSQTSDKNETLEGIDATFTLIVGSTGNPSTSATLLFNNTEYSPDTINQNSTNYFFSKTLTIPTGTGNSTGRLVNWYWQYSINNIITDYNTSTQNMTIFAVDLDNCSTYSTLLLNMTLYDENENAVMDISNQTSRIETDISLKLDETTWSYNTTLVNNTNLQICVPDYIFNYSDFLLYMTTYYTATDYAAEFYHIDGQTISKDTIPKIIYLRDLPLKDSTSFIFLFKDQYDIEKSDVIVETLRNYIGSSEYNIVERGKTDDNGQTALHLIEEDAIYRFKIYENEELIFSSIDYKAICEEVPCSIKLRQDFETTEIDEYLNNYQGVFSASANPSTRTLEIEYETQNPITLNLTLYQINYSSDEDLIIANDYATATSGKLSVNVPLSYGNDSFYYALTMSNDTIENAFVSSGWVNLKPKLSESNDAMAWLLSGLFLILMVLFGAAEGLFMIVFLIMGVIAISLLLIVSIPQGIITLIVIGGLAIAWKLYNSR